VVRGKLDLPVERDLNFVTPYMISNYARCGTTPQSPNAISRCGKPLRSWHELPKLRLATA
jgi:hypothetical protein